MKATTIFKTIVLSSIMAFAVGCGKDNKSGNGYGWNMPVINGLGQNGTNALATFRQWYENGSEPGSGYGTYVLTKTNSSSNGSSSNNCRQEPIKIFGTTVGYYTVCSGAGNNAGSGTQVQCSVVIQANANNNGVSLKSANPILRKLYTGGAGTLVDGYVSGNVIVLAFQEQNGAVSSYQIDRTYHSAFQPIASQTSAGVEQVRQIQSAYQIPAGVGPCY